MGRGRRGHGGPRRAANNSNGLITYFLMSRSWLACSPRGYLHLELGCAPARGVLPICSSSPLGTLEAHGEVHAWQPRSVSPRPLSPSIAPPRGRAPVPGSGFPLATGGGRAGTGAPGHDQDEPGTPSLCWVPHFSPPPFFFISAQGEIPLRLQDVFLRG